MNEKYIKKSLKNFNGPYISSIPEIDIHQLQKNDEYLVLSTDGMWDYLNNSEVSKVVRAAGPAMDVVYEKTFL